MLLDLFLVRFFFNFSVCPVWWSLSRVVEFVPCGGVCPVWWTKLATCQLFTAR